MHMKLSSTAATLGAIATLASAYPQNYDHDLAVREAEAYDLYTRGPTIPHINTKKVASGLSRVAGSAVRHGPAALDFASNAASNAVGIYSQYKMAQGGGAYRKRDAIPSDDEYLELLVRQARERGHGKAGRRRKHRKHYRHGKKKQQAAAEGATGAEGAEGVAGAAGAAGAAEGAASSPEGAAAAPQGEAPPQRRDAIPEFDDEILLAARDAFPEMDDEVLYELYARDPDAFLGFGHLKVGRDLLLHGATC